MCACIFGPQELQALCRQAETTLEDCVRSSFATLEHSPAPAFACYSCVTHPVAKLRKLAAQQRTPILVGSRVCWFVRQDAMYAPCSDVMEGHSAGTLAHRTLMSETL